MVSSASTTEPITSKLGLRSAKHIGGGPHIRQMVRKYELCRYQFYIGDGVVWVIQPLPLSLLPLVWDFG